MAALSLPELPEMSRTVTPGFPELPAPPLGGGRNGKEGRDRVALDFFGMGNSSRTTSTVQTPQRCWGCCKPWSPRHD